MVSTLEYPSDVSVETVRTDLAWFLVATITVSDPFPANLGFNLASLYEPFIILSDGQHLTVKVSLKPSNGRKWGNIWTILVDPNRPLPKFLVAFWSRFGGHINHEFEVDTWKVTLGLTPTLYLQATAKRETPTLANDPKPRIDTSPDGLSPGGGDRWHENQHSTPIDEEQMDTIKQSGSSTQPLDVSHWFDEGHHRESVLCLQATNKSASAPLLLTTSDSPGQRETTIVPSISPKYQTVSEAPILKPHPRRVHNSLSTISS